MSTRIAMSGLGFVLVAGGGALAVSRALEAGPIYPATLQVSPSLVYTVAAIGVAVGALMWLLTPQRQRRRVHVRLDKNPLAGHVPRSAGHAADASGASVGGANGAKTRATVQHAAASGDGSPAEHPPQGGKDQPVVVMAPGLQSEPEAQPHAADPRHRIEELAAEANRLKVEYALGRVSPQGYKAALEAIDHERSELESALFQSTRAPSSRSTA